MKYKLFGRSGLRVSEICLGTMTFGKEWGWGADYETSLKIFDTYAEAGGNFIDTANRYTDGTSEKYLADFIKNDRDHFVLATKYSLVDRFGDPNYSGNHRKNMMRSVEESLKRLETDTIDLLWLHAWDFTTPVEEILRGLNDLIAQGKVHYIGISDTPAWIVAQANTIAELRGWNAFVGLQVEYSLLQRTVERDLIPMAKQFDLAITPWAPLAGGALTGKYILPNSEEGRVKEDSKRRSEWANKIVKVLVDEASKINVSPAQLALKWVMEQGDLIIPIVGARKVNQLEDSLKAIEVEIPTETMQKLNEASAIELGFPHDFLSQKGIDENLFGGIRNKILNHRI